MEGTAKGLRDGPGPLSRAPLPAALFLAHRRRAPEGRAGNPDSFPAAPSPPSPRLLLGRPEANPPLDGRDPTGPAAQLQPPPQPPRTVEALSGLQQLKSGGSRPRARPRPLGLPGSSVRGWHQRARSHRRAPRHPHPAVRVSEATQAPECQWWCPLSPGTPCSRNPGLAGPGPIPNSCP